MLLFLTMDNYIAYLVVGGFEVENKDRVLMNVLLDIFYE